MLMTKKNISLALNWQIFTPTSILEEQLNSNRLQPMQTYNSPDISNDQITHATNTAIFLLPLLS